MLALISVEGGTGGAAVLDINPGPTLSTMAKDNAIVSRERIFVFMAPFSAGTKGIPSVDLVAIW
jgi:hypothetical protein